MEIESAIQQYLVQLKETAPREEVERELHVLARLQEYLAQDMELETTGDLGAADLRAFIRDWYREGEDVSPKTTELLVRAVLGWARWLDRLHHARERGGEAATERQGDESRPPRNPRPVIPSRPLASALEPLAEALPRTARAAKALRQYARRDHLEGEVPVEMAEGGTPLGLLSTGLSRVVRLEELDYTRAEEDTFEVVEMEEQSVALLSLARRELGEGPASPVAVPAPAVGWLRVGDVMHVEIAPSADSWEILHVETVFPGGLDDRP